ncbi:MAG TPA: hypothetical protein VHT91_50025 [Kofleriaceae bacterium]|jgi:hypothetical protein|nr:hypothetical protein [Kofleriaceae bacterium]
MKKIPFKRLALAAETIRNLTAAELRGVGGGVVAVSPLTTTHSITSACNTFTIATTPARPSGQSD